MTDDQMEELESSIAKAIVVTVRHRKHGMKEWQV
jgi:hypothetical protein